MTWLQAQFYDGHSAARQAVEVEIAADGMVRLRGLEAAREYRYRDVQVSERIGRTPRIIRFPDGSACELSDNDAVDAALDQLGANAFHRFVHVMESRWAWALSAAVAIVLVVWAAIQFGIPALAEHVARIFPPAADRALGAQAMQVLDKSFFKESTLPPQRQAQLRKRFADMTRTLDDGHEYRLELRRGDRLGANAFALPSGIVVMTDEMVKLAEHDEELAAVLAHEIGHVVHRHSLRMLLQNSATSALMISLTGDVSSATVLVAGVPTVLVQARYSRQFETEADDYAYQWLDRNAVPRSNFGAILQRLEKKYGGGKSEVTSWLSSHPQTAQRIRN